jgi:methyl-accepting chemotaxis protein
MNESTSVQVQSLAIAFLTTVICLLTTVFWQDLISTLNIASPQYLTIVLIALVAVISVGVDRLIRQSKINDIHRNLEELKTQFEAVTQGDFSHSVINLSPEFMPLASSLQQMIEAVQIKLNQAQEKAELQAKQNEYLEDKLMEIIRNLDLTDERNLLGELITDELDEEPPTTPAGSLLEFLDNFHKWSQLPTAPELLLGSSSIEEIQQRQEQLKYRQVWLQAILEETQREIKLISPIAQLAQPNQLQKSSEG